MIWRGCRRTGRQMIDRTRLEADPVLTGFPVASPRRGLPGMIR